VVSRPEGNPEALLADALARARKLVAELEKQGAEVEANPPKLSPEKLAQGKQAFEMALAAARRMLKALEEAAELAPSREQDQ
jgi:hypothetical protein